MAWTNIANSEIDQDSPITQTLMTAYRDNLPAAFNGAVGAPRLQLAAFPNPTVGNSPRIANAAIYEAISTSYIFADGIRLMQFGSARFTFEHRAVAGTAFARVLRNGVQLAEWSTTSSSYVLRVVDFGFSPGDFVAFEHRFVGLGGLGAQMRGIAVGTGGEYIIPVADPGTFNMQFRPFG